MATRNSRQIYQQDGTASGGALVSWIEMPENISNLSLECSASGTLAAAGAITFYRASRDGIGAGPASPNLLAVFTWTGTSTLHTFAATDVPRYLKLVTSQTAVAEIVVNAHFLQED